MEYPIGNYIEYAIESHGISYSKCNRISHGIFLGILQNILLHFIEYAIEYSILMEYPIEIVMSVSPSEEPYRTSREKSTLGETLITILHPIIII